MISFIKILKPIIVFIDKALTLKSSIKQITGDHYYLWRNSIRPGYVLLSSAYGHGSNWINPGDYKHGALYYGSGLKTGLENLMKEAISENNTDLGNRIGILLSKNNIHNDICYVLEATGKGVIATNLVKFMTTKDRLKVLKPTFVNNNQRLEIIDSALKSIGLPYDFAFSDRNGKKYCFELIAEAYENITKIKLNKIPYKFLNINIHETYSSNTFTDDSKKWACVIDSDKYFKKN